MSHSLNDFSKRIYTKMLFVILSTFAVIAIPESAFAIPPTLEFEPLKDDAFIMMIRRMFGTIIDLNDHGTTALTDVIIAWSSFVLIIGGGLISYGLLLGTMNTAHQGEALGKKWNSMWVPIRTMTAFAMVLPLPATAVNGNMAGLSAVQGGVIQLVRMGSGMADSLWTYSAQQIASKGFTQPQIDVKGIQGFVSSAFKSFVCVEALKEYGGYDKTKLGLYERIIASEGASSMKRIEYTMGLPKADKKASSSGYLCGKTVMSVPMKLSSIDKIVASLGSGSAAQGDGAVKSLEDSASSVAYSGIIDSYSSPTVKLTASALASIKIAHSNLKVFSVGFFKKMKKGDPIDQTDIDNYEKIQSGIYNTYVKAIENFNGVTKLNMSSIEGGKTNSQVLQAITSDGWAMAGTFYWKLKALTDVPGKIVNKFKLTPFSGITNEASDIMEKESVGLIKLDSYVKKMQASINKTGKSAITKSKENLANIKTNEKKDKSDGIGWVLSLIYGSWKSGDGDNALKSDPVLQAKNLGDHISNGIIGAWAILGALYVAAKTFKAVNDGVIGKVLGVVTGGGSTAASGAGVGIAELAIKALIIATPLLIPVAFLFSTVIPMMPYMMFLFALVGYSIFFIEAMVAAPVWAIFHAHPDGEDFTGKFGANGYMLSFGLLMRPSMMIIGFVAGMFLVNNLGVFLHDTFFLGYNGMRDEESGINLLSIPFEIVLYGIFLSYIIYKSFELTYELPRAITDWIGGQNKEMGESQGNQKVLAMASGVGSGMSNAASGAANRSAMRGKGDKKPKPDGDDKDDKDKNKTNQDVSESKLNDNKAGATATAGEDKPAGK